MAKIIITRTNEYLNRWRDYGIYIDESKNGNISNGETKEINIPAGQHAIFFKIDWCSSPTLLLDLNDHEIKQMKVGGFKNGKWLMPLALVLIILSYFTSIWFYFDYLFYLVIPPFLLLVYYLTIGRKKYLTITENKIER